MQVIRDPDAASNVGAYSPALKVGDFVFVSGQGPINSEGQIVSGTIEEEVRLTMNNIKKLLEAAGVAMDRVVKCTCHLADINDFDRFDQTYCQFFDDPLPTRTTVESGLAGIKVEIDAIAYGGK